MSYDVVSKHDSNTRTRSLYRYVFTHSSTSCSFVSSKVSFRILSILSNLTCIQGYVAIDLFQRTLLKFPNLTRLQVALFKWEPDHLENLAVQCPNLKILCLRFDSLSNSDLERNPVAQFSHVSALQLRALPDEMDKSILFSYFPNVYEVIADQMSETQTSPAVCAFGKSLPKTVKILSWWSGSTQMVKSLLKNVQLTILRVKTKSGADVFSEEVPFPQPNTKHLFVVTQNASLINGRLCIDTGERVPRAVFTPGFLSV